MNFFEQRKANADKYEQARKEMASLKKEDPKELKFLEQHYQAAIENLSNLIDKLENEPAPTDEQDKIKKFGELRALQDKLAFNKAELKKVDGVLHGLDYQDPNDDPTDFNTALKNSGEKADIDRLDVRKGDWQFPL